MKISAFMNAHMCPALAKKFSDRIPRSVTEMFTRVDDFTRSEGAYHETELPKGETAESGRRGFMGPSYERSGRRPGDGTQSDRRGSTNERMFFIPMSLLRAKGTPSEEMITGEHPSNLAWKR